MDCAFKSFGARAHKCLVSQKTATSAPDTCPEPFTCPDASCFPTAQMYQVPKNAFPPRQPAFRFLSGDCERVP